jgi:hypothetical protein
MRMLSLVLATTLAAAPATAPGDKESAADAAGQAWTRQLAAELSRSSSPRERALSTQLATIGAASAAGENARRGALLREAAMAAPGDRLVQWLWATADEKASGCDAASPCPARRAALARLEPDNIAAWSPLWATETAAAIVTERDATLASMARASHADFLFAESVNAWMEVYEHHPMPGPVQQLLAPNLRPAFPGDARISPETVQGVGAISMAAAMDWPSLGYRQYCKTAAQSQPNSEVVRACRQVGKLMAQGASLSERSIGLALLRSSGGDDPEAQRRLEWLQWHFVSHASDLIGSSADFDRYVEDLRSTRSEIRAIELLFQRRGISVTPPANWQKPRRAANGPDAGQSAVGSVPVG